jgi:hypothetical protein
MFLLLFRIGLYAFDYYSYNYGWTDESHPDFFLWGKNQPNEAWVIGRDRFLDRFQVQSLQAAKLIGCSLYSVKVLNLQVANLTGCSLYSEQGQNLQNLHFEIGSRAGPANLSHLIQFVYSFNVQRSKK